ncbi:unnamed protein product [Didymodactylos carnosus]|uniref:Uncharacterized protein n=1 Tax=Didymodactylos carnosus TaxID=1234261 RepID=A0A813XYM4_9BILA|nr:unnamed protein product [Didymodactylos carnosus]CAF0878335.1 unnamed protein product [Didymodactylos carnosus]CAF3581014.1 unnamed protein product [Didymodactylos carnosus]CAF3664916.1 unnamed protein product [Didymodactylos carnosus]
MWMAFVPKVSEGIKLVTGCIGAATVAQCGRNLRYQLSASMNLFDCTNVRGSLISRIVLILSLVQANKFRHPREQDDELYDIDYGIPSKENFLQPEFPAEGA